MCGGWLENEGSGNENQVNIDFRNKRSEVFN